VVAQRVARASEIDPRLDVARVALERALPGQGGTPYVSGRESLETFLEQHRRIRRSLGLVGSDRARHTHLERQRRTAEHTLTAPPRGNPLLASIHASPVSIRTLVSPLIPARGSRRDPGTGPDASRTTRRLREFIYGHFASCRARGSPMGFSYHARGRMVNGNRFEESTCSTGIPATNRLPVYAAVDFL
jgi:hypothetical protein